MTQQDKARVFKELHVKGDPLILFNIWDPNTATVVAHEGAKALATSSHAVANSYGYEDGEFIPIEIAISNIKRIVESVEIPVSVDFEAGYGKTPEDVYRSVQKALETGMIGINLEDASQDTPGKIRDTEDACARIEAARKAADDMNVDMFINARTNLFAYSSPEDQKKDSMLDDLLEKEAAFHKAGGSGFFAPGMQDLDQIKNLCDQASMPVNIIWLPGFPSPKKLAKSGASRISYGPGPYLSMIEWFKDQAKEALA